MRGISGLSENLLVSQDDSAPWSWLVGWLVAVVTRGWSNGLHVLPPDVPSEYSIVHSVTWYKFMLSSYRNAVGILMWNDGCCSEKPLNCGIACVLVRERQWCAVVSFTAAYLVFWYGSGNGVLYCHSLRRSLCSGTGAQWCAVVSFTAA